MTHVIIRPPDKLCSTFRRHVSHQLNNNGPHLRLISNSELFIVSYGSIGFYLLPAKFLRCWTAPLSLEWCRRARLNNSDNFVRCCWKYIKSYLQVMKTPQVWSLLRLSFSWIQKSVQTLKPQNISVCGGELCRHQTSTNLPRIAGRLCDVRHTIKCENILVEPLPDGNPVILPPLQDTINDEKWLDMIKDHK